MTRSKRHGALSRARNSSQVGDMELVVEAGAARLLDHAGGEIDADQPVDVRPERRAASPVPQPRSSTRSKPAVAAERAARRHHRVEQQLRPAIVEPFQQREVVMPAHTGRTARAHSRPASASPRRSAAPAAVGAVAVRRIGRAAPAGTPRPRRRCRRAAPCTRRARTRPRRSRARAPPPAHSRSAAPARSPRFSQVLGELVAPVGDQVAGGDESRLLHRGT